MDVHRPASARGEAGRPTATVVPMLERLDELARELADVEAQLSDPDVYADQARSADLARRHKELEQIVSKLRELMVPPDPHAGRDVIVEIRGAEGGEEANLFARDLFEMYRAWIPTRGWALSVMDAEPSPMGGLEQVTFQVKGDGAWTHLKHEGGPHRVQRVPATESQGRIHTSSATVTVLPEADEVDVQIDPNDLQIDVYRSSGPGGQSVNTPDSAVRISH